MLDPYTQIWNGKWKRVYEDEFGVNGFSGRAIDKNDLPKLKMSSMSWAISTCPIEVYFYDKGEWFNEDGEKIIQLNEVGD